VLSTSIDTLVDGARGFLAEPERAREAGRAARVAARERFGLERFLADWDALLEEMAG
jgi:hypothetical protein